MKKTVWVHAWEYVNGTEPGGGGFDWFHERENALAAYNRDWRASNVAHFFFPYETEAEETAEQTTAAIDGELHEACARAAERWVGDDVATYWQKNGIAMGAR